MALTQLATELGMRGGAMLVKSAMEQEPMAGGERKPRCPTCSDTGRISCLCSHWSDSDIGCRMCVGSGRMPCSSCGGTGRPIPATLSVLSSRRFP